MGHDAAGDIFAIDGGGLGIQPGQVCYLAPDSLYWEGLEVGHTDWVHWSLSGDLNAFYGSLRWASWEQELAQVGRDEVVAFYPFLWTKEGDLETASRKTVPLIEHLAMRLKWPIHPVPVGRLPPRYQTVSRGGLLVWAKASEFQTTSGILRCPPHPIAADTTRRRSPSSLKMS